MQTPHSLKGTRLIPWHILAAKTCDLGEWVWWFGPPTYDAEPLLFPPLTEQISFPPE